MIDRRLSLIGVFFRFTDSPKRFWPIHWIYWLASLTGVVMVLVAHGHYTVDVLIAYYATTRLFWTYHTLANNSLLLKVSQPRPELHA